MLEKLLSPILNVIKFHKKKVTLFSLLTLFFLYFIFPFNDLGDFVALKVSEATNGQVFVGFDTLDINLIPEPGIAMSNVQVETPFTPKLTAKNLSLAPNIAGLLSFKPGINAFAKSLLGGNVELSTRGGDKSTGGKLKQKISLDLDKLSLQEVSDLAQLPLKITGNISGSLDSQIDLEFADQPTGEVNIQMEKVQLPESSLNTQMGPLELPHLNLNNINLEGHADKGSLDISKLLIGKPGGDFYANASGKVDVKFEKFGATVAPRFGAYDFNVKMQVGEEFKSKLGAYLSLLQNYQTAANSYSFRVSGANFYAPPKLVKSP
jgi:type II secretion system protein N